MIIKIIDRNTNLEKEISNLRKYDLMNFECDTCHKESTYKYRPKRFDIKRRQLCSLCKAKLTSLKRYGYTNPNKSKLVKDKIKVTSLKVYGVDNISKLPETQLKIKHNNLEKYGVDSTNKLESVKQNKRNSCMRKYGVDNPSRAKEVQQKREATFVKHLGVKSSLKDPITKEIKATNLRVYGAENPFAADLIKKKIKEILLDKYGVDNPSKSEVIKNKKLATMKRNHTFNSSKLEREALKILKEKFNEVDYQCKDKIRYPFACDFYIPEKDLFIECNFFWTHGKERFDENNFKHITKLKLWKSKPEQNPLYKNAINTWTIR